MGFDDGRCDIEDVVREHVQGSPWNCGVGYEVANYAPTCALEAWFLGETAYWLDQAVIEEGERWEGHVIGVGEL